MKEKINGDYLKKHKQDIIRIIAVILAAGLFIGLYCYNESKNNTEVENISNSKTEIAQEESANQDVYVDICGAVKEEKVIALPSGSRIEDAIEEAGGLKKDADLSSINRAEILEDGQKIYIPFKSEAQDSIDSNGSSTGMTSDGLVNINNASCEELETLNGIGPVTAQKIVQWRTEYGRFERIEDLMEVNGIGEKTFAKLKEQITV